MTKISESKTLTGNPSLADPGFNELPYNPLRLLQQWLSEADRLNINEPRGLVLSTVDSRGRPSSRVVLLKTVDETGAIFASSSVSKKGLDLDNNHCAAGTLWWRETMQQVNFCGVAKELPSHESDEIWSERTPGAQAVAILSQQSSPMVDDALLRQSVVGLIDSGKALERPVTWCGYHIEIQEIEFWHGSQDRFHNRLRYNLNNGAWQHQKLQP